MLFFIQSDANSDTTEESDSEVAAAWATEAKRRWQEIESGAVKTIPWEDVRTELLREK